MAAWRTETILTRRGGSIAYRYRGPKKTREVQVKDVEQVYEYNSHAVGRVVRFAAAHEESEFENQGYDDPRFYIYGWREATPEEIERLDQHHQDQRDNQRAFEEAKLEAAREVLRQAGEL